MPANKETLIKKFNSTAEHYEIKGKREWAYAKNDWGDEHYGKARRAFDKAKEYRRKARDLKKSME